MPTRRDRASFEVDVDIVPVAKRIEDLGMRFRIGVGEIAERLIGKHDTPAERVVGTIAFDDGDVVAAVDLLQQQREIKAGGPSADAYDAHLGSLPHPICRRIAHFGNSLRRQYRALPGVGWKGMTLR